MDLLVESRHFVDPWGKTHAGFLHTIVRPVDEEANTDPICAKLFPHYTREMHAADSEYGVVQYPAFHLILKTTKLAAFKQALRQAKED